MANDESVETDSVEYTDDFNQIDHAHQILTDLLDDEDVAICSIAGEKIQWAADLIK